MSGSYYPTLSMTIPLYNLLIDHIEDVIGDENEEDDENLENNDELNEEIVWDPLIKDAAKKCKVKLLDYYNKTHNTYLISTILDPRLKLKYYKDHNWDDALINTIYQK
jgi:hypothetical protein